MRRVVLASLLSTAVLSVACSTVAIGQSRAEEPEKSPETDAKEIAEAIRRPGDSSFRVREAAQRVLLQFGEAEEKELKVAIRSTDAVVAKRAKAVLEEISNRRLDAELGQFTFDAMMGRSRRAAANEEWKQPGWKDAHMEGGLNKLIEQVRLGTKNESLRLPVGFGDVKPGGVHDIHGLGEGEFHDLQGGSITHIRKSTILSDGSARVGIAQDCVIIARGAVEIAHERGNVVIAGHYLQTGQDGKQGPSDERFDPRRLSFVSVYLPRARSDQHEIRE